MKLTEHFTIKEFTKSDTALRRGIDNTPKDDEILKLQDLCYYVLEPIRAKWGPVRITSGYRSPALNDAIGGSQNSQHSKAEAADFECPGHSNLEVAEWIRDSDIPFDQMILEFFSPDDPNSGWIHISFSDRRRGECLTAVKQNGKTVYLPGLGA